MLRGVLTDRRLSASVGTGLGQYPLTGRRSNVGRLPLGTELWRDFVTAGSERLVAFMARSHGKIAALGF